MNAPRQSLETLLRSAAAETIADDGFSARVAASLPLRAPRFALWKPLLNLGATALGCALAVYFAPAGASLAAGFQDLAAAHFLPPSAVSALATAAVLMVGGAILAATD